MKEGKQKENDGKEGQECHNVLYLLLIEYSFFVLVHTTSTTARNTDSHGVLGGGLSRKPSENKDGKELMPSAKAPNICELE